jgi:hypothetical protein
LFVLTQKPILFFKVQNVRIGKVSQGDNELLQSRVNAPLQLPNNLLPIKLYATNEQSANCNNHYMSRLTGDPREYHATQWMMQDRPLALLELWESCLAEKVLQLKVDTQVMLIKNLR